MDSLATTQRRLWRLLTAPDGVAAALSAAGDPEGASLRGWVRGDAAVDARRRLEVYANAYFERIHDVLADDFGALAASLGADGFHDLVTAYLLVHPPRRPSLRHAGAQLADFLADGPEAEPFRRRWPFAADLARLETALSDAFDARDATPLVHEDLARLPAYEWERLCLEFHPSVRLVPVEHAVDEVRSAFDADAGVPDPVRADAGTLAVWRRRERAFFRRLEPDEAEALAVVWYGRSFGALCDTLAEHGGEGEAPARAAGLLATWVDAGMLIAPGAG